MFAMDMVVWSILPVDQQHSVMVFQHPPITMIMNCTVVAWPGNNKMEESVANAVILGVCKSISQPSNCSGELVF